MIISLSEYAARHGKNDSSARRMALRGRFATTRKVGRNWVIDKSEPWPDYRTKDYQEGEKKAMGFEYTDDGNLIVDGVYTDLRYPNGCIVQIGGSWYICNHQLYNSGVELAKALRPLPRYVRPESLEPAIPEMAIMAYSCAYREIPEERLTIGRAITPEEFAKFATENGLTDGDISQEFEESWHEIYGDKHKKTYVSRQVRVEPLDTLRLEAELKAKGIEAHSGSIGRINIRIK